ncbi:MAG: hypothetical protein KGI54_10450 [Pseudomonadota bacterium]|nr:hypothetical protein [Pseudomonadota bacterium]
MKKLFSAVLFSILLATSLQAVSGPFAYKQLVTSAELNWAFANAAITSGTISGAAITNTSINSSSIGATTPSTGNFTSIGASNPGTGNFTALSINGAALASLYSPISYSQTQINLSASTVLTTAQTQGQIYYTSGSVGSVTLPDPTSGTDASVTLFNASGVTLAVTAPAGVSFAFPDNTASAGGGTFYIQPQMSVYINWISPVWRVMWLSGNTIVANATASNQAVALGQLTGTASLSPNFINQVLTGSLTFGGALLQNSSNQWTAASTGNGYGFNNASAVTLLRILETGEATFSNTVTVSHANSSLVINKSALANSSALDFQAGGAAQWAIGTNQGNAGNSDLGFYSYSGAGNVLFLNGATGAATFGSTVQSANIVAGKTVTITAPVSGTVYQNTNAFAIDIYEPVTYNATGAAAATDEFLMGSTNTPSAVFTNSEPATSLAGIVQTDHVTIPPSWYYEWTVANATLGTAQAFAGLR